MMSRYLFHGTPWALLSSLLQQGADAGPRRAGNRYRPHQGKQEVARRRRQIAAGILRVTG